MIYGKVIRGFLKTAKEHYGTEEEYIMAGYKPVELSPKPNSPDGYRYEVGWEEQTSKIVQTWGLIEAPDDVDDAEALDILLGGAL